MAPNVRAAGKTTGEFTACVGKTDWRTAISNLVSYIRRAKLVHSFTTEISAEQWTTIATQANPKNKMKLVSIDIIIHEI